LREVRRLRLFQNRVLRIIFGAKRDGVTGEWRKLHNGELYDLFLSPYIFRVIRSRKMRLVGYVALMEMMTSVYRILVDKPRGKRQLGISSVEEMIILSWIFRK
jgi:hypothetical protein